MDCEPFPGLGTPPFPLSPSSLLPSLAHTYAFLTLAQLSHSSPAKVQLSLFLISLVSHYCSAVQCLWTDPWGEVSWAQNIILGENKQANVGEGAVESFSVISNILYGTK